MTQFDTIVSALPEYQQAWAYWAKRALLTYVPGSAPDGLASETIAGRYVYISKTRPASKSWVVLKTVERDRYECWDRYVLADDPIDLEDLFNLELWPANDRAYEATGSWWEIALGVGIGADIWRNLISASFKQEAAAAFGSFGEANYTPGSCVIDIGGPRVEYIGPKQDSPLSDRAPREVERWLCIRMEPDDRYTITLGVTVGAESWGEATAQNVSVDGIEAIIRRLGEIRGLWR